MNTRQYAWLCKAVDSQSVSTLYRHIHSTQGWVIGTDGRRVHAVYNKSGLEEGSYDPVTREPAPSHEDIMTDGLVSYIAKPLGPSTNAPMKAFEYIFTPCPALGIYEITGVGFGVKQEFLDEALEIMDTNRTVVVYATDKPKPIKITDGRHLAIIANHRTP